MSDSKSDLPEGKIIPGTPHGWVYQVDCDHDNDKTIPMRSVVGAWRADGEGKPTGEFVPNPDYRGPAAAGNAEAETKKP